MRMDEREQDIEIVNDTIEHTDSNECQCAECKCGKKCYVQIIDVDRYIDNLNDWD